MQPSYSVLAHYYDKFTHNDCDYIGWSQYLYCLAQRHGVREVADIACGTGKMTALLLNKGLKVIGIDNSAEMLEQARAKCRNALFVLQDMRKLRLAHCADMAICVNDGVNYLKPDELAPFFKQVASNLVGGAPFVFDVSTKYKLQKILSGNVFYYDGDDETLLWCNGGGQNCVKMDLTLFVRADDGKYERRDESHVQYVHTTAQIKRALRIAGFQLREVTADYGKPLQNDSLRACFYATKN